MTNTSRSQGSLISLILRRGREARLAQTAGGLTFTIVVSMVPLLAVSFAVFARIPALREAGEAIREHLLRGLLPAEEFSQIENRVQSRFNGTGLGLPLSRKLATLLGGHVWRAQPFGHWVKVLRSHPSAVQA